MQHLRPVIAALLLSAAWTTLALGQRSLRGTVTDAETGLPITAARVSVHGTRVWATTNAEGRFTLNAPSGAVTLEVRRIGFQPASIPITADQSEVDIKLKATALQLSELVVTGQATSITRRNLANGVQSVSAEELNRTHSQTVEDALQGKVAGAVVTANSGAPVLGRIGGLLTTNVNLSIVRIATRFGQSSLGGQLGLTSSWTFPSRPTTKLAEEWARGSRSQATVPR